MDAEEEEDDDDDDDNDNDDDEENRNTTTTTTIKHKNANKQKREMRRRNDLSKVSDMEVIRACPVRSSTNDAGRSDDQVRVCLLFLLFYYLRCVVAVLS